MGDKTTISFYNNTTELWCRQNSIHREKVELFHDFLSSLIYKMDESYLGKDVIYENEDIKNHFKWCWESNIDQYAKENINFKKNGTAYRYFSVFFFSSFYFLENNEGMLTTIAYNFIDTFHIDNFKTEDELSQLKTIYDLLNNSLI